MPKTPTLHFPHLAERVRRQRELQPALYGDVDFDAQPYRLATDPGDESSLPAKLATATRSSPTTAWSS